MSHYGSSIALISIMLVAARPVSAQQHGIGNPASFMLDTLGQVTISDLEMMVPGVPDCTAPHAFRAGSSSMNWNVDYGGVESYFLLPVRPDQTGFLLKFKIENHFDGYMWSPEDIRILMDGVDCPTCWYSIELFDNPDGIMERASLILWISTTDGLPWRGGVHEFAIRYQMFESPISAFDIRFKVLIAGPAHTVVGTYDAPALPLFVLRDPPGDVSYSSILPNAPICVDNAGSVSTDPEPNGWFPMLMGSVEGPTLSLPSSYEFSTTIGSGLNAVRTRRSDFGHRTCLQATQAFHTPNTGPPDDVIIASSVRYRYGLTTMFSRPTCATIETQDHFIAAPESTLMTYSHTESDILNTEIPLLGQEILDLVPGTVPYRRAVEQRDVWQRVVDMNRAIKANAAITDVIDFNGGVPGQNHSCSATSSSSVAIDYNVILDNGLSADQALGLGGSAVPAGGDLKMRSVYGSEEGEPDPATNVLRFRLDDDDPSDVFSVQVRHDPSFGTCVFQLDSSLSRTSCRYEGGYRIDQPDLSVGTPGITSMTVNEAPIGSAVNFPLIICNESDVPRTYYIRNSAISNPNGAILALLGNTIHPDDPGMAITMDGNACITIDLMLTQPSNNVVDLQNINVYLYAICEEEHQPYIRSYVTISAHFGEGNIGGYCVPATLYGTSSGDYVDGVQLGDIQHINTGGLEGPSYTDNTADHSTALYRNTPQVLTVTSGAYSTNHYAAWIDYDHDGAFGADERLGEIISTAPEQANDIAFTVPADAPLGATRLRVRAAYAMDLGGNAVDPCLDQEFGETEDYTVFIEINTAVTPASSASFNIRPNPSNGLFLLIAADLTEALVTVNDATGREVLRTQLTTTVTTLDLSDEPSGTYYLRATSAERTHVLPLMIVR